MLKDKDRKILDEMKDKIKSLPLSERITAVAIYRLTEQYFNDLAVEENNEEKLDAEYKVAETAVLKENQQIISGARACTQEELSKLNQFLKEGENLDVQALNQPKPIEGFWHTVLKNANICRPDLTETWAKPTTTS